MQHTVLVGSISAYAGMISGVPAQPLAPVKPPYPPRKADIEKLGWMLCDGRKLKVAEFPELYSAIGFLYGGEGGWFNLPNLEGMFLRGVDYHETIDPDTADRTGPAGRVVIGGVGSQQSDAVETHTHPYNTFEISESVAPEGAPALTPTAASVQTGAPKLNKENLSSETRPVNFGVNFIIRVR